MTTTQPGTAQPRNALRKGLVGVVLLAVLAAHAGAAVISLPANDPWVSVAGYTYFATGTGWKDGDTSTTADYILAPPSSMSVVAYDFGGIATVESVQIYQCELGRGAVTAWRVFYQGGYQDFTGVGTSDLLTLTTPVQTGFVAIKPLAGDAGDSWRGIAEVSVNGTAPASQRSDLAAGKTFSTSGWANSWGTAALTTHFLLGSAYDYNAAWNPVLGVGNNYIQIDLGTSQALGGVGLLQLQGGRDTLHDFQMQFSDDPAFSSYTSQDLSVDNALYVQRDFTTVSARYVRLVAKTVYSNGDANWGLARVQLFSGTAAADSTPPVWAGSYPKADTATNTGFTIRAKADEAGTAYYVVVTNGATAPTTNEVKNGTASGGGAALANGSITLTAVAESNAVVTGLSAGASYVAYLVAEDSASNLQSSVASVSISTLTPDTTPPVWASLYPKVDTATSAGFTVRARTDSAGTAYYVVVTNGATAPTANEVKNGTASGGGAALANGSITLTADTESNAVVTGLSAASSYVAYLVAEDVAANLQATATNIPVTTLAPPAAPISRTNGNPWVTVAGYVYNGVESRLNDGDTNTTVGYLQAPPSSMSVVAYDFGGVATVESVQIYQCELGRGTVTNWRVFYQGGYQDLSSAGATDVLTLASPVQSGYVAIKPLAGQLNDAWTAIAEVAVNGTAPAIRRVDRAAGKTFTTSGWGNILGVAAVTTHFIFGSGYDYNAAWNPVLGVGNNYIQIDLGASEALGGVGVLQLQENRDTLHDFQMQFSDDPAFSSYTSQDLSVDNALYVQRDFTTVSARYVRLVAKTVYSNGDANWGLARVQLFSGLAAADSTPPVWAGSYPKADTATNTGFTIRAKADEAGTAYYVVVTNGATAPTTNEVKNGTASGGGAALANGSITLTAVAESNAVVTGLSAGASYVAYLVAEDSASNLQSSVASVSISTLTPDTTPPVWASLYPKVDTATSAGFTVRARTDSAGTAYYVVVTNGATAPTANEVKNGTASGGGAALANGSITLTADTESNAVVTGLSAASSYVAYLVAEDVAANLQATATNIPVTTLAPPAAPISRTNGNPWVTVAGYVYNGVESRLNDGDTNTTVGYLQAPPSSMSVVAYDFGGVATVESVQIYQCELGRGTVTNWRVFYQGGYQDLSSAGATDVLTLASPVQSGYVAIKPLAGQLNDAWTAIAEVAVNGTAPAIRRVDRAAGKTFTTSGWGNILGVAAVTTHFIFGSGYDYNAAWNPVLGVGNNYIQIDLGASEALGGVGVLQLQENRDTLHDFQMQFSDDPAFSSYTSQDLSVDNALYVQRDFTTVSARYVRLVAKTVYSNGDGNWGLARVQLFGQAAGLGQGVVYCIR